MLKDYANKFPMGNNLLKCIVACLLSFTIFSCKKSAEANKSVEKATQVKEESAVVMNTDAALQFINDYVDFCNLQFQKKNAVSAEEWIDKNDLVTPHFKTSYLSLLKSAENEYLDADPILDAQDYPEQGFELSEIKDDGFLIVQGKAWKEFQVVMKLVQVDNKWLVDACGIINIPSDQRLEK